MYGHNGAYGAYGGYAAAPPPMHGAPPPPASGYQPPPPQPGYGAAPPGYGRPASAPPAYSAPPPGPPGYGSPPSYGYGSPPPPSYSGYGAPPLPGPPPRPPDGPTVGYGPPAASSRPPNRRSQDSGTGEKSRKNQRSGKGANKGSKGGNDRDNVMQVQKKQKVEQNTQQKKKNNSDAPARKQKNKKNNDSVANEQKQIADAPTPHPPGKQKSADVGKGNVKGVPVNANIYVHGIPPGWNDDELKENFKKFGTIVSAAVARKPDGASKGYGFVGYDIASSANAAIASLDGATVEERLLTVKLKDGGGDADGKTPAGGKGKAPRAAPGTTAYIYQIPREWSEAELERHFSHCGTIASVKLGRLPDGTTRGFGFIDFANGPIGVLKAMIGMDNFNAGPRNRLQVNPKQGEEELVPPIPDLEFPPPANPFDGPTRGWSEPGSTIFVFYLPREWTEWELFLCFAHLGEIVNCKIQTKDNESSGQKESRGFGFLSFANKLSAVRAVKAMNGFDTGYKMRLQVSIKKGEEEHLEPSLNAMKIVPDFVHVAKAAGKGGAGKNDQSSNGDLKKVPPDANVFVHHLPPTWTEKDLRKTFETHGNILALKIVKGDDGVNKGFGFVGYESAESAKDAISNLDGYKLDTGKTLIVKLKDEGRAKPY